MLKFRKFKIALILTIILSIVSITFAQSYRPGAPSVTINSTWVKEPVFRLGEYSYRSEINTFYRFVDEGTIFMTVISTDEGVSINQIFVPKKD